MKWALTSQTTFNDVELILTTIQLNEMLKEMLNGSIEKMPNAIILKSHLDGYWKRKKINFFTIIYEVIFNKSFRKWLFKKSNPGYVSKFETIKCRFKNHPYSEIWHKNGNTNIRCIYCGDNLSKLEISIKQQK